MAEPMKLYNQEPIPEVIEHLEGLLKRAKDGELVAIAYATESREGWGGTGWTSAQNAHCLQASVMRLFSRISLADEM